MNDAYNGMYLLSIAALVKKGIKPYNWPEVDEQVFEARFKLFSLIPVPRYVDYETFSHNQEKEIEKMEFATILENAKLNFTAAQ